MKNLLPEAIDSKEVVTDCDQITDLIRRVRGVQVMLDYDLAKLYGVQTGQLNRQVKRNIERFPADFMVRLTKKECENLKCQFGISSWGGSRQLPYAFTEQGVAMLSSVLKSKTAIEMNIAIIFDALGRGRLLPNGIIPAGTEFDSIRQVSRLVEDVFFRAWRQVKGHMPF